MLISCGGKQEPQDKGMPELTVQEQNDLMVKAKSLFGVLPDKMPGGENDTPELIELGKKLYFETKLSINNTQSCNTCHDITNNMAGVDNKPVSPGAKDKVSGTRNSPTVFNAGYHFVQFWDGRAKDLKEQAKGPILNPVEMAMPTEKEVEKIIGDVPEYKELFVKAFPADKGKVSYDNIAHAIAAFERTLISKSRYDQWIAGNSKALTSVELMGMKHFIETGCITCHTGPLFGGNMYQKMGLVHPYENQKDQGRYDITKVEADKMMFKVPTMRNVALTQPYFHDGAEPTLKGSIEKMAWLNLGKKLTPEETEHIEAFLKALTDVNLENAKKSASR